MNSFTRHEKRLAWSAYPYCCVCGEYITEEELMEAHAIHGHAPYRVHGNWLRCELVHKGCHPETPNYGRFKGKQHILEGLLDPGEPPACLLSEEEIDDLYDTYD